MKKPYDIARLMKVHKEAKKNLKKEDGPDPDNSSPVNGRFVRWYLYERPGGMKAVFIHCPQCNKKHRVRVSKKKKALGTGGKSPLWPTVYEEDLEKGYLTLSSPVSLSHLEQNTGKKRECTFKIRDNIIWFSDGENFTQAALLPLFDVTDVINKNLLPHLEYPKTPEQAMKTPNAKT